MRPKITITGELPDGASIRIENAGEVDVDTGKASGLGAFVSIDKNTTIHKYTICARNGLGVRPDAMPREIIDSLLVENPGGRIVPCEF